MVFKDEFWMQKALEQAKLAEDKDEVPIGAVIVYKNIIIGTGYNQSILNNKPTSHAEIIAIESACKEIKNYRLTGASIYVTVEPCLMCAGAIINSRISRLVFGSYEKKTGAIASNYYVLSQPNKPQIDWSAGVMEEQTSSIIKKFFTNKRR